MFYKNDVFKISFTGIMFSLVLLFQYLERFMPLNMGYINLNLSLIFILVTNYVVDIKYAILLFILRFLFGPALSESNYSGIGFWAHFILLAHDFLFFLVFILIYAWKKLLLWSVLLATLGVSMISGVLNGLLFIPVYWAIMKTGYGLPINLESAIESYANVKDLMYFGISHYWGGMFGVHTLGNIIKFSVVGFVLYSTWKILLNTPYKGYIIDAHSITKVQANGKLQKIE